MGTYSQVEIRRLSAWSFVLVLGLCWAAGCGSEHSTDPENALPLASFVTGPAAGDTGTVFTVDASDCNDPELGKAGLVVRWDWEDDGEWDTEFSSEMTAEHRYAGFGVKTIRLEVADREGNTQTAARQISVLDPAAFQEETTDLLGFHDACPNWYRVVNVAGARVLNLPERGTFFVVWLPAKYFSSPQRRVLLACHGTGGFAYAEVDAELQMAEVWGHAVVGLQWCLGPEAYLEPDEVHELIDIALWYMRRTYGADPQRSAYTGFSRGSAISYEVSYWDRKKGTDYLAQTISHSGGVNPDAHRPFFDDLVRGVYGQAPFAGTRFYMYASEVDEEWPSPVEGEPSPMVGYMEYARDLVRGYGGAVLRFIQDTDAGPDGGHAGFRNPAHDYHEVAIEAWYDLTP